MCSGSKKVVRGGGWDDTSETLKTYFRFGNEPANKDIDTGFRCAKSIE